MASVIVAVPVNGVETPLTRTLVMGSPIESSAVSVKLNAVPAVMGLGRLDVIANCDSGPGVTLRLSERLLTWAWFPRGPSGKSSASGDRVS